MKYSKTKLLSLLQNTPRQGWTWQKIKDLIDSLWRDLHPPVTIAGNSADYLAISNGQVLSFNPENIQGGGGSSGPAHETPDITETPAGTLNGSNKVFTLSKSPVSSTLRVYINGVRQKKDEDYTLFGGEITFETAPFPGDIITADYSENTAPKTRVMGETPSGNINGANMVFTLAANPETATECVFLNGIRQCPVIDYSIVAAEITFTTAPFTGDILQADYMPAITEVTRIYNEAPTGLVNGVNTNFVLLQTPLAVYVYLNGVRQKQGTDYTLATDTITFAAAPFENDVILVDYEYEI